MDQIQTAGEQIATGSGQVSRSLSQHRVGQFPPADYLLFGRILIPGQVECPERLAGEPVLEQTRSSAEKGNSHMKENVTAMREIREAGANISRIIKTIDEIAFHANLLALNSAVEAVRAGHHGKRFAVVAELVRNLAARSAKAANETAELIEGSVARMKKGAGIADKTAEATGEIVTGIIQVSDLVAEIDQGFSRIDEVTRQNSANPEQSAEASWLKRMLARFKVENWREGAEPTAKDISWNQAAGEAGNLMAPSI